MSKSGGVFRGIRDKAKQLFKEAPKKPETRSYPDPVFPSRGGGRLHIIGEKRKKKPMSCDPGTIQYHDRLTRHFGHKRALAYGRDIQANNLHLLPSEDDFRNTPPFGWVKGERC